MQAEIIHLKHSEIDKQRWDACIDVAPNGLIYALSWYLDVVAPRWEALVMGDYEAVMPLPVRKKFGIYYLFLPFFTQQLGVFAQTGEVNVEMFMKHLPPKFKLLDLNLNEELNYNSAVKKLNTNYKLNLSLAYEQIKSGYNRNCNRNLKKAGEAGFQIHSLISPAEFAGFVFRNLSEQIQSLPITAYVTLESLVDKTLSEKKGELVCLFDAAGVMHSAGFFLFSKSRLIFSVCASTDFGKANQSMYMLVDSQIKKYAGKFDWFDFSGSNIKGIAYFNSTFGAKPYTYQTISINRLPFWLRYFKK